MHTRQVQPPGRGRRALPASLLLDSQLYHNKESRFCPSTCGSPHGHTLSSHLRQPPQAATSGSHPGCTCRSNMSAFCPMTSLIHQVLVMLAGRAMNGLDSTCCPVFGKSEGGRSGSHYVVAPIDYTGRAGMPTILAYLAALWSHGNRGERSATAPSQGADQQGCVSTHLGPEP